MPGCREPGSGTTPAKLINKESFLAGKEGHRSSNVPNTSSLPPSLQMESGAEEARSQSFWQALPSETGTGISGRAPRPGRSCASRASTTAQRGVRRLLCRGVPAAPRGCSHRWSQLRAAQVLHVPLMEVPPWWAGQLQINCCDKGGITHPRGGNWHISL